MVVVALKLLGAFAAPRGSNPTPPLWYRLLVSRGSCGSCARGLRPVCSPSLVGGRRRGGLGRRGDGDRRGGTGGDAAAAWGEPLVVGVRQRRDVGSDPGWDPGRWR